ncbi:MULTISPECIES: PRC-barrel domain-containing protein [Actinokineospora]|nr:MULTISPECIES: PRC-barrel domain-containing protein [Actinokineospora]UVS76845.1 PRC-barrel domain protein [Actinokineospora sp. UTMC 2448]
MKPQDLIGHDVYDPEGERIGRVGTVYVDGVTREPEWVTVRTGLFGHKETFVPLRGAQNDTEGLRVGVRLSVVKDAPQAPLSDAVELFRYYGFPEAPAPVPIPRGPKPSDMPRKRVR